MFKRRIQRIWDIRQRCQRFSSKPSGDGSGRNPILEFFSPTPAPRKEITNPLLREMIQEMRVSGPITVSRYMRLCLTHPVYGFYMNQDVFGAQGHFTTSPEVSQIFGELISIWIMYHWQQFAGGKPLDIIELGPGRGTLAADLARTMAQFAENNRHDCRFHLVEISPHLRSVQERKLCGDTTTDQTVHGQPVSWYESPDQIRLSPERFPVFLANEFFDAFPVHKFVWNPKAGQWRELLIDYSDELQRLIWIQARHDTPASKLVATRPRQAGDHLEHSPETLIAVQKIAKRLNDLCAGCLLICDYGYDDHGQSAQPINRDTFRAYRHHQQCDPLEDPGRADLTADVDFDAIRRSLVGQATVYGTVTQRHFLEQMGITFRLKRLLQATADEKHHADLIGGVRMLMEDMGERFRFMAILPQMHPEHQTPVAF